MKTLKTCGWAVIFIATVFLTASISFDAEAAENTPMSDPDTAITQLEETETRMIEETEPGDLFLLCSDGLYDMVPDDDLLEILTTPPCKQSVCGQLLDAAMNNGGRDNVTVIVVKIQDSLKS